MYVCLIVIITNNKMIYLSLNKCMSCSVPFYKALIKVNTIIQNYKIYIYTIIQKYKKIWSTTKWPKIVSYTEWQIKMNI